MTTVKKIKPNDDTTQLLWEVLRSLEEKCGNNVGPFDALLILATYRHVSKLLGKELLPTYVKESDFSGVKQ